MGDGGYLLGNSYSIVLFRPSLKLNGGVNPLFCSLSVFMTVSAANFLILIELTVNFLPVSIESRLKVYPPSMPTA